jgi:hypothetical protein
MQASLVIGPAANFQTAEFILSFFFRPDRGEAWQFGRSIREKAFIVVRIMFNPASLSWMAPAFLR